MLRGTVLPSPAWVLYLLGTLGSAWIFPGAAPCAAQVFEVQAGSSSFLQATGGGMKIHMPNYDGRISLGNLRGLKLGGSLKTKRLGHIWGLGDELLRLDLPSDAFDGGRFFFGRGLSLTRQGKRGGMVAFAGGATSAYAAPFFQAAETEQGMGLVVADYQLRPTVKVFSRNLVYDGLTAVQGVEVQPSPGVRTALAGGVEASRPYLSSSFFVERSWVSLKAAYVQAARRPRRRVLVSTINSSQANRENIVATFFLKPYFTLTAGRQNLLQPQTSELPASATINQYGMSLQVSRFNISSTFYDSHTEMYRNRGSSLNVAFPVTDRIQVLSSYFRSMSAGSPAVNTMVFTVRESLWPQIGLSQLVTRSGGRTSVAFGGSLMTNRLKLSAEWQTIFVPFRRGNQFKQALVLNVELRLFGDFVLHGGTDIAPDGSVRYTAYGNTFLYRDSGFQAPGRTFISFPKYIVRGQVTDEKQNPIGGAAIRIGQETVFTDSEGNFFQWEKKVGPHPLAVPLEDFLAPGSYEVVSAPQEVTAAPEEQAPEVQIIVRRKVPQSPNSPQKNLSRPVIAATQEKVLQKEVAQPPSTPAATPPPAPPRKSRVIARIR